MVLLAGQIDPSGFYPDHPDKELQKRTTITDLYKKIMDDIFAVKEQRGLMYRREPKDIVPIETLEHLAYLKAVRGMESLNIDKKIDDYTDLVNYAVFVLERLYKEKESLARTGIKGTTEG